MAKLDISGLSLEELTTLIEEATKLRAGKVEAKRQELQKQLAALDAFGVEEKKSAPVRAPAKATHRSKKDPSLTWSSRGAKPRWLVAEMAETGLPIDAFKVSE